MRLALLWKRFFATKVTAAYFIFSILTCVVQTIFQIRAFTINDQAGILLTDIARRGINSTVQTGFAVLTDNDLRWCNYVPSVMNANSCYVIWSPQYPQGEPNISANLAANVVAGVRVVTNVIMDGVNRSSPAPVDPGTVVSLKRGFNAKRNNITGSVVANNATYGAHVELKTSQGILKFDVTEDCTRALNYPAQKLKNTKREDISFLVFQYWLLGMSLAAMLNESIPHIITSLVTHVFVAAWGIFQVVHTQVFQNDFTRVITNGPCAPHDLLPDYWALRRASEIPSLAFNLAALFISALLTWLLIKQFGWQTYKHLGSNVNIRRSYDCVATLAILLQLSLYFMITGVGLWLDQLYHGPIAEMATSSKLFEIIDIVILIFTLPWLALGWYSVRKESRWMMIVFLLLTFTYVVGFAAMFLSDTFRWTFITWVFFGMMETIAAALAISVLVLSIFCRVNFGKGLKEALDTKEEDEEKVMRPDEDDFAPASFGYDRDAKVIEKVDSEALNGFVNVDLQRKVSDGSSHSGYSAHRAEIKRSDSTSSTTKKRWAIDDD